MATTEYIHDLEYITIENCISSNKHTNSKVCKLPKGSWEQKINKVNKKIRGFEISDDIKWILSVNSHTIQQNDVNQFAKVLSSMPPPIIIKIIKVQ